MIEVLTDGDLDNARSLLAEAVAIARDEGLTFYAITGAYIAAAIAAQQRDFDAAATLIAAADSHNERLGVAEPSSLECRQRAQQVITTFGDGNGNGVNTPGQAMTVDDLIDYMLEVLQ